MKSLSILAIAGAGILAGSAATAQEPQSIFATYYRCDPAREADLDPVIAAARAELLEPLVEAGRISAFAWRTHVAGTSWRRLATFNAPDRTAVLEARADILERAQAVGGAFAMLNDVCSSHDDYIWNRIAASDGPPNPDAVLLSTYYTCDQAREARADEIYTEVIGPAIEAHVDMGHLVGWTWWEHDIGGTFRRLGTIAGTDFATILNMREAAFGGVSEDNADELGEFLSICSSHEDYLWGPNFTG